MAKMNHALRRIWRNIGLLSTLLLIIGLMGGCAAKAPAKPGMVKPEGVSEERVIYEITVTEEATQVSVIIKGNQPLTYTSVKQLLPLGVVLYFPKTSLKGIQETYTPESPLIKSIVTAQPTEAKGLSRIQIDLKEDVPYRVSQEENQLLIHFRQPTTAPKKTMEPTVPELKKEIEVEKAEEPGVKEAEAEKVEKPAWVNRIDFVQLGGGKSRIIVATTRSVGYETERPSDKRLLLKLFNTRIPEFQKRPVITTRFKSAVDRIIPLQTPRMGDTAIVAIDLRQAVPYRVDQQENVLAIDFEPSSVPPRPLPDVEAPKWQQVIEATEAAITREAAVPPEKPVLTETGKVYKEQKITLDFQDADIHHVFRILHDISGKNFVIEDDVRGKVTLKLDNVPWDQVLDLVLKINKLGTVIEGNVIRIATLKTLAAEQKALEAKVKAEDRASKARKEREPLVTEYIPINYSEASSILKQLEGIKTDRGKVGLDERTNMIIMTDVKAAIQHAREVVKKLDVVTPQVMIEARIIEANTDFSREFGIQWGGKYGIQPGDTQYGIGPQRGYDTLGGTYGFTGAVGDNWVVNLPAAGPTSGIGFNFARLAGLTPLTLQANLQAMEAEGKLKIISSPKILTLDNKQAYIEQGLEIPYQVLEEGSYSLKWAKAVLKLEVTPHITMDGRVNMKIVAKKDAPDWSITVQGAPGISKKEAGTELLVNDGDTIVIGGIITREESFSKKGVPGLSKIPVLGWLFKSQSKKLEKKELLIFVTPTIVRLEKRPGSVGSDQ